MKFQQKILFFIQIYSILKITFEQNTQNAIVLESKIGMKSILIGDSMIYIFNEETNFNIYFINPEISPANHNNEIQKKKDILKKDESNFIIIGLNVNDKICFENYVIENNNIINNKGLELFYIPNSSPGIMEARYIKEDKLLVYTLENLNFRVYLINFKTNRKSIEQVEIGSLDDDKNLNTFPNPYIKCESLDGISYFCIYYYRTTNSWKMNYTYGNFSSNFKVKGSICNDLCSYGNIIKVNFIQPRYLICYVKVDFNSNKLYNIICQYYYFDNGKMITEKNYDLCKDSGKNLVPRPLIIYSYKNSLFLQYDYIPTEGESSRIIIFSPDLEFNIHSNIHGYQYSSYQSVNLFNTDQEIYLIFELNSATWIKEQALINSGEDENITLSQENNYISHLSLNNKNFVAFSLNENIILTKNSEIIAGNNLIDLSNLPSSEKVFSIEVKDNAVGVFTNYICFMED